MTAIEWVSGVPTSNYKPGRDGNPVALIIDHWMGSKNLVPDQLFASALGRFLNPASIVSAHFLVGATGRIVQIVATDDTAYHAGDWSTNTLSIGIEHECSPTLPPTDALYAASAWLHRHLSELYDIDLDVGTTVRPHNAIVPTQCPGTLDLAHIVALAKQKEPQVAVPIREGQSADLVLRPGQVGTLDAAYDYGAGPRSIGTRKVFGHTPGRRIIELYPPEDIDADETLCLDAEPAVFVVDIAAQ